MPERARGKDGGAMERSVVRVRDQDDTICGLAVSVNERLLVDPADAFYRADVVRVLGTQTLSHE
jgi:hypothetical protein